MDHVFISYVRENSKTVEMIIAELKAAGVEVWLDVADIKPGKNWRSDVENAIQSGAYFIACFSKEYEDRKHNMMAEEIKIAIKELRKRPDDTTWFIPIMLNKCEIPRFRIRYNKYLSDLQYVQLFDNWSSGMERILDVVLGIDRQYEGIPADKRQIIRHFIKALYLKFPEERCKAIEGLSKIEEAALPAVTHLGKLLAGDPDLSVRIAAATSLGNLGKNNQEALSYLIAALSDNNLSLRISSCRSIIELGKNAISVARSQQEKFLFSAALEVLQYMSDKDPIFLSLRYNIIDNIPEKDKELTYKKIYTPSYSQMASCGEAGVDDLIHAVESSQPRDGFLESARSLGSIGKHAKKALPTLFKLAEERINEWAGERNYSGQYEDQITGYLQSIGNAIRDIIREAEPEKWRSLGGWEPKIGSESDPEHTYCNEVRFYIKNLDQVKSIFSS